ncbi:MAG: adenylate/guanylate cyclase domain-containing protein [Rhodopila sp.]|nr:adenylate/guanylate cyclase domain-containing protein [Rhodopila sp.]
MTGSAHVRAKPLWLRKLRLVTGLTLFYYVTSHLLNHSLGNISIPAMEAGMVVQKWVWQGVIGTAVLYSALTTHYLLGLWAFYERRHFGWTVTEVVQLVLGLSIPFLLMNHLFVTRISLAVYATEKGYAQELYSFWVSAPHLGVLQVSVLIVAWIHGCIGLYQWLRLKPMFTRWMPYLFCSAILLPVLALLGFFQGGRTMLSLAQDPAWRAANLNPWQIGTPPHNQQLVLWRDRSLWTAAALLAFVLLARLVRAWREWRGTAIRVTYPNGRSVRVPIGFSVLEASRSARIPHASICGGRGRCSTCRIRVIAGTGRIPPPLPGEQAVLRRIAAEPVVRLACQLRPMGDISVVPLLPADWPLAALRRREWPMPGEERFIVVLMVDMRDSTRLIETRLPFDAVFIVDRFVTAAGAAVDANGGRVSHFLGDGLMATFGLGCGSTEACRQALSALIAIGHNVENLNRVLLAETGEEIRFGVGVHCGSAVVGEIGYGAMRTFTTLGDAANVAARLEGSCKHFGCEAVISHDVWRIAGLSPDALPGRETTLRGRSEPLLVHPIEMVRQLKEFVAMRDGASV